MSARKFISAPSRPGPRSFGRIRSDNRRGDPLERETRCIGCGCQDSRACWDKEADFGFGAPCSWLRVDHKTKRGVCSACPGAVTRWDEGDRALSIRARRRA